jgi:hypothetical protein
MEHARNSNSEDALTWSCFDVLRCLPHNHLVAALDEILEDVYDGDKPFSFADESDINIYIGKWYNTVSLKAKESTEVDISIETANKLIFFEAKLYGSIEMSGVNHLYDQIIKKMRVGLDVADNRKLEFYFIFLDIANAEHLSGINGDSNFCKKRNNATYFTLYKTDSDVLEKKLSGITKPIKDVAHNMGWLTWACLYKTVLRAVINSYYPRENNLAIK